MTNIKNTRRGAVLLLTLIVMSTLLAISVGFLYMSSVQTKNARYDIESSKAFWLAEAGLQRVKSRLKNDEEYREETYAMPLNEDLGDGGYSAAVSKDGNIYTVVSTGMSGSVNRKVRQGFVVNETGWGSYPDGTPESFYYAMHSFGRHTMFKDSTGTVNGDVAASNFVKDYEGMTIRGGVIERSGVATPAPPDMAGYKSVANHVEGGEFIFTEGSTYGAPESEEIWYITGNVTIERNVVIYGSVIAENNIFMGVDNITIKAASGCPAMVSGNNIHANGLNNSIIKGLVFADNNVDFDNLNDVTINGAILSDNNTFMRKGGFIVNFDSDIIINPPPFFPGYKRGVTVLPLRDWNEIVPAS